MTGEIPTNNITVFLLPKDYSMFLLLKQQGVFDVQYGKVVLNYKAGMIETISKDEIIYKRTSFTT